MNNKKLEVLWSGGWDSTFMLCYLAKHFNNFIIQPYYLDIDRPIRNLEVKAVKKIYEILKRKTDLKSKIIKPKFVKEKFIQPDQDILLAIRKLHNSPYKVGGQYKFIAQFARNHKSVCWGQERFYETPGHLTRLLNDKGNIKFNSLNFGYFEKENCDEDVYTVFGNLICPIMHFSEPMMLDKIKEWHYEDIFREIRFCYFPINNEPCGMCYYCDTKFNQHMDVLFSDVALARRKVHVFLSKNTKPLFDGDILLKDFTLDLAFQLYQSDIHKDYYLSSFHSSFVLPSIEKKINDTILMYKPYFDSLLEKALHDEELN